MKVILLQDVAKIGRRFKVAEVPNGYALNQLIPQGKAEAATPVNLKRVEARTAKLTADKVGNEAAFTEAVAKLKEAPLTIAAEANDQGHLFEALKPATIATAATQAGIPLAAENVLIAEPIKSLGEHQVRLQAGPSEGTVTINVARA